MRFEEPSALHRELAALQAEIRYEWTPQLPLGAPPLAGRQAERYPGTNKWSLLSAGAGDRQHGRRGVAAGLGLERYIAAFRDNEIDWEYYRG